MDSWRTERTRQLAFRATPSEPAFPGLSHHQPIGRPPIEREVLEYADVNLSAREHAIVFLMSHGMSNKQMARRLSIAPETVKSHAKRIFLKLSVCSRAQAVYRAAVLGLIALQ